MKRAVWPALACSAALVFACDGGENDLFRMSPSLIVTPLALDFGAVLPGTPAHRQILLTNIGTGSLVLTSARIAADSHAGFDARGGPVEIVPNGTMEIIVTFTAAESGEAQAQIEIRSDDPVAPLVTVPAVARSAMDRKIKQG